jgi:hypothetical protein
MSGKIAVSIFTLILFSFLVYAGSLQAQKIVTDGLVSFWTFDSADIEGDTAKDVWGGNHGEIIGKAKIVEGKVEEALEFDGGTSFVDCGNDESLNLTDAITIEVWINPNSAGEGGPNAGPLCKADAAINPWSWQLRYNAPGAFMGFQFNANPGGSTWISVKENLSPGDWYHIVGTFDGSDIICYLNGEEKEKASIAAITGGAGTFFIGQDGWVNVFDGVIDEVRIYDRALNQVEILQNYGATSQLALEPVGKLAVAWGKIRVEN